MSKHLKSISILSTLMLIFMFSFYGKFLTSPNSYLIGTEGDAMKNYYTYQYLIKNNEEVIEFDGMNFPYSENFMYTDCHPVQASVLKFINSYFPILSDYSIGLLNLFMIIALLITALIIFFIFIELKVNKWLSILSAIGITILSPQIFRFSGHWALSYSFAIPIVIYLLLRFEKTKSIKYLVYIFLSILFLFFTHGYLGMIASLVALSFVGVDVLYDFMTKNLKINFKKHLKLLIAASSPILVFFIFMKVSDSHLGRTTNPWGIYEHHAEFENVFLPFMQLNDYLSDFISFKPSQPWEGMSYIGVVAIVGLVMFIFRIRKNQILNQFENSFLLKLLLGAFVVLCVSILIPFGVWEKLIEKISLIKQFRAIGRFAWVFYFVANIVGVYAINLVLIKLKESGKSTLVSVLTVLLALIMVVEGVRYHSYLSSVSKDGVNVFDLKQTDKIFQSNISAIDKNEYQAIIMLPYFYVGSDNYGKQSNDGLSRLGFMFSYHLNLPMFNSYLTRTSIEESKNIIQLMSSNFYPKAVEKDITSDKPFLIVCHNEPLSANEELLIKRGHKLSSNDEYSLYEITKEDLFYNTSENEITEYSSIKNSLKLKGDFLVSDSLLYFQYVNFKSAEDSVLIQGDCYQNAQSGYSKLLEVKGEDLIQGQTYVARFWMYNGGKDNGQDSFNGMAFFEKEKDSVKEWIFPITSMQSTQEINGDWNLVEVKLTDVDINTNYQLLLKGDNRSKLNYYIDDIIIYNESLSIYKEHESYLFKNGHRIPKY
jgi:hypothetical protein